MGTYYHLQEVENLAVRDAQGPIIKLQHWLLAV